MGGDLTGLSLNFNGLAGTIPPEIDNLTNLTWLYLNSNELTEKRPQGLVGVTEMLILYFHTNAVLYAPTNQELQRWFNSIEHRIGPIQSMDFGARPRPTSKATKPHGHQPEKHRLLNQQKRKAYNHTQQRRY